MLLEQLQQVLSLPLALSLIDLVSFFFFLVSSLGLWYIFFFSWDMIVTYRVHTFFLNKICDLNLRFSSYFKTWFLCRSIICVRWLILKTYSQQTHNKRHSDFLNWIMLKKKISYYNRNTFFLFLFFFLFWRSTTWKYDIEVDLHIDLVSTTLWPPGCDNN